MGPAAGFPNLLMFKCSKNSEKAASHLTVILPKNFKPESFARESSFPEIDVLFLIDGRLPVAMSGEYKQGELFFDLTTETRENFDKILNADSLALSFGEKNDRVEFQFNQRLDALLSSFFNAPEQVAQFGPMTMYARSGAGGIGGACRQYQHPAPAKANSRK
jgi:hypothetical protein